MPADSSAQARLQSQQLVERATDAFGRGQYKEAITFCSQAVEVDPLHMAAYVWRAAAAAATGDIVRVIADCTAALNTRDPLCLPGEIAVELARRARIIRASAYLSKNDFAAVVQDCSCAVNLSDRFPEPFVMRGTALAKLGQRDKARADYQIAVSLGCDSIELHAGLAYLHFQSREFQDALRECTIAIERGCTFVEPYLTRCNIHLLHGRLAEALEDCSRAFALNPQSADAHCNRGAVYAKLGRFNEALRDYSAAIELASAAPVFYLRQRAVLFMFYGRLDDAIADCNRIIALDASYADGFVTRAQLFLERQQFKEALSDLNSACALQPDCAAVYLLRALTYNELHNYPEALSDAGTALSLGANFSMSLLAKANAHCGLNQFELALADADAALQEEQRADGYHMRGLILLKMNKPAEAIGDFSQALALGNSPVIENTQVMRALAFCKTGDYEKAMADLDQVLQKNPSSISALSYRLQLYILLNAPDKALQDYNAIIARLPSSPDWLYRRATLYMSLRQYALAIEDTSKAIEFDPNYIEAYFCRGLAYSACSQTDLALADLDVCSILKPSEEIHLAKAAIYMKLQDYDRVLEQYDQALEHNPISALVYYHKTCAYIAMQRYEDALFSIEKAADFQPENALFIAMRGLVCYHLGLNQAAVDQLALAIERSPGLACAYIWRAESLKKLNRYEEAAADEKMAESLGAIPIMRSQPEQALDESEGLDSAHGINQDPVVVNANQFGVLSPNTLSEFEEELGVMLPLDYRNFLLRYNGGCPMPCSFMIPDTGHINSVQNVFGLHDGPEHTSLYSATALYAGRVPASLLPIADDVYGNLICIGIDGQWRGRIVLWEARKETPNQGHPGYRNILVLADSFSMFLEILFEQVAEDESEIDRIVRTNDSAGLRALLQSGWDCESRDEHGRTILEYAAIHGRHELVEMLKQAGARPGDAADYARQNMELFPEEAEIYQRIIQCLQE